MILVARPAEAIEQARTREAVAVIEFGDDCDWWMSLGQEPQVAMFECLRDREGKPIAVALGRIAAEDLGACPDIRIVDKSDSVEGELLATCGDRCLVLVQGGTEQEAGR